jgi:exoribonuclease R
MFQLDADGNPIAADVYEIRESNQLIEEYMLLANYLVAQKLVERVGRAAFLRRHKAPRSRGMPEVLALAETLGVTIDTTSAFTLQRSLRAVAELRDDVALQAITALLMRPLPRAEYFAVADEPSVAWRHYALAIPYYTHFTSPIRRYADVVVHRLLLSAIAKESRDNVSGKGEGRVEIGRDRREENEDIDELQRIADHCNFRKDASQEAQTRCDMVYLGVYLANHPVPSTEAVVISISEKSMTVFIIHYAFSERLFYDKMDRVLSTYDSDRNVVLLSREEHQHSKRHHEAHSADIHQEFTELRVGLMARVAVRLTSCLDPLVSIRVDLVGLYEGEESR